MSALRSVGVLLILSLLLIPATQAGQKKFEKTFQVSPGGTFTIDTDIGTVMVTGSSSNEVVVTAVMEGRDRDIEEFHIDAAQTAGGVEVKAKGKKDFWRFLSGRDFDVRFTVSVPSRYNLKLETSGGDVEVTDIKGMVQGETSGGDIRLTKIEGKTKVETSGGDILIDGVTGELHAETSGGDVTVKGVVGDVDAETSGGNVRIDAVDGKVHAETSGGNVTVRVAGPNKGIHAETSGGNITVVIARNVGATIDASTSGGDVECDLAVTVSGKISESRVKGTVNGGGSLIYAHTSGGNVRIKAVE